MDDAIGIGAFLIAFVTTLATIYSAKLGRDALQQEARLRAKEHAQQFLDASFREVMDLSNDYFQNPWIMQCRRDAAVALLKGEDAYETRMVIDYLDNLGLMLAKGMIDEYIAYEMFGGKVLRWGTAAMPLIERERVIQDNPTLWEDFIRMYNVFLSRRAASLGRTTAAALPSQQLIVRFLQTETTLKIPQ